jgi:hypothetical protein
MDEPYRRGVAWKVKIMTHRSTAFRAAELFRVGEQLL